MPLCPSCSTFVPSGERCLICASDSSESSEPAAPKQRRKKKLRTEAQKNRSSLRRPDQANLLPTTNDEIRQANLLPVTSNEIRQANIFHEELPIIDDVPISDEIRQANIFHEELPIIDDVPISDEIRQANIFHEELPIIDDIPISDEVHQANLLPETSYEIRQANIFHEELPIIDDVAISDEIQQANLLEHKPSLDDDRIRDEIRRANMHHAPEETIMKTTLSPKLDSSTTTVASLKSTHHQLQKVLRVGYSLTTHQTTDHCTCMEEHILLGMDQIRTTQSEEKNKILEFHYLTLPLLETFGNIS